MDRAALSEMACFIIARNSFFGRRASYLYALLSFSSPARNVLTAEERPSWLAMNYLDRWTLARSRRAAAVGDYR